MIRGKLIGLGVGAAALLGVGVWLGGQRASAELPHVERASNVVDRTSNGDRASNVGDQRALQRHADPTMPATKPAMPGLAADLRDPDPKVRRNAIAELAASDAADPDTLLAASRDENLDVALAATEGLGALYRDGKVAASDLVARATDATTPVKVRVVAINGLGAVASPESAAALGELLHSSDTYARSSAAILMVHQDPTVAMPALIAALRDTDENTRSNAHESLRSLARGRDLGDDPAAWQRWWAERTR